MRHALGGVEVVHAEREEAISTLELRGLPWFECTASRLSLRQNQNLHRLEGLSKKLAKEATLRSRLPAFDAYCCEDASPVRMIGEGHTWKGYISYAQALNVLDPSLPR